MSKYNFFEQFITQRPAGARVGIDGLWYDTRVMVSHKGNYLSIFNSLDSTLLKIIKVKKIKDLEINVGEGRASFQFQNNRVEIYFEEGRELKKFQESIQREPFQVYKN